MKTVLILAGLVALALGSVTPEQYYFKKKGVESSFVEVQKKLLGLVKHVEQVDTNSLYYKTGKDYVIEDHIDDYTNKKAVEEFLQLRKTGLLPKYFEFSVFYDRMRDEAISLFHLFYYAKDFETFYKTASWARVYLNNGQFLYAFYIAVIQRPDTQGYVLPAPYEVYPKFFINLDTLTKIYRTKMQDGIIHPEEAAKHGIFLENGHYYYFSNYTNTLVSNNLEQKLSYFTEDIGLNAYYYYFHSHLPFWWTSEKYGALKSRRGELYYYIYQQLITRYYFERLTNGLGEVPQFSWYSPVKTGYYALMKSTFYPFAQRPDYMNVHTEENYENIRFLNAYESSFLQFLQSGHFKAYDQKVDFHDPKAVNFVGNYWQDNADLFGEEVTKDYQRSYEVVARRVLGAAPEPFDKYTFMPSPLVFYQTSLRDPMFYQLYSRILSYIVEYKQYLEPYTSEKLGFNGVKIVNVDVEKLVTFFEYYDFDAINSVFLSKDELTTGLPHKYMVRQPRINQKPFSVTIDVKSEVAVDAVFKIFLAPKYDANGFPLSLEEKWNKFFEIDWFTQKLTVGSNKIVKKSTDFIFFKDDSRTISDIEKMLEEGQIPEDMAANFGYLPRRLMLPKGTESGFPFELFVYVYHPNSDNKELATFEHFIQDNKPLGYPFDRPVVEDYFKQPNMYFKDVWVFHEGKEYPYQFHPSDTFVTNAVPKN